MKESSKKTLVRSTWPGHVDNMGDENWQREQMLRNNLEIVGEELENK